MDNKNIVSLVELRAGLIKKFDRLRDYKNNKNAIMKEFDHAQLIAEVINKIDIILKGHVEFK